MKIEMPDDMDPKVAFQHALGEIVEWSAGKVRPELLMTMLVALAGAVGRGVNRTFDDAGLRQCFDHGFNSEAPERS